MSSLAKPAITPPWNVFRSHIVLWHGCIDSDARSIQKKGIDLARGRCSLDFGRGFYATTNQNQAIEWAKIKHFSKSVGHVIRPSVLAFHVPLARLARLESLMFVRGDTRHDAFWSFVHHCRGSTAASPRKHFHPTSAVSTGYYDVVVGPVAAVWPNKGRAVVPDYDQFSFHSLAGIAILNDVIHAGAPGFTITVL